MGVAKKHGYQLSVDLENGQKYSMMFVEGTLGEIKKYEHVFEKLSVATKSENILTKRRTGKNDFTQQNNAAKLFVDSATSCRIVTKGEKTFISYKMSKMRILAWSPIYAYLLFLSIPFTIQGIYAITSLNDGWLLNFSAIAALWIVPFIPALVLSLIGYFVPGGGFPVRMSRVVIDVSERSVTWEHKYWPRFFTKKETIGLPVNMSFDSGFYTYFDES
jgi:hypothetical protein|tara:strand:- start:34 stop:687 length:654 start_codon:yes stop_codon:yes gene_type:complete